MSAPTPCPICRGRCCFRMGAVKADTAYVPHGDGTGENSEDYRFHVCVCFNGTTTGDTPMPLHPAAEGERAAVVRWLRGQLCVPGLSPDEKRLLGWASRRIESAAHHEGKE